MGIFRGVVGETELEGSTEMLEEEPLWDLHL